MRNLWRLPACAALAISPAIAETTKLQDLMTLHIDGKITIDSAGKVADYTIETELPNEIRAVIDKSVPRWLFAPPKLEGAQTQVRGNMRITLAATPSGEDHVVRIDNVTFPKTGPTWTVDKDKAL